MDNDKLDELERVARSRPLDYETTLALITAARRPEGDLQKMQTSPLPDRDGWVLVPREPTEAMVEAAGALYSLAGWTAMLSAAPKVTT